MHIFDETSDLLVLPVLNNKIVGAKCLTGGEISYNQTSQGIMLNLRKVDTMKESVIIELTFQDSITGMALQKHRLSMFTDPIYGQLISKSENLQSANGSLVVKLGQLINVTGIGLQQIQTGTEGVVTVEVSADGVSWKLVKEGVRNSKLVELTVSQFNAGIHLPGVNAQFVRLSGKGGNNPNFQVKQLTVYARSN